MAEPKKGLTVACPAEKEILLVARNGGSSVIGVICANGVFHTTGSHFLSIEDMLDISKKCAEVKEAMAKLAG